MRTIIFYFMVFLFCLGSLAVFGQGTQNHRIGFSDMDGFSGEVSFTSSRHSFGTTLKAKGTTLKLTNYHCSPEEKEALQNAGIDFWAYSGYSPHSFQVHVKGRAYVLMIIGDAFDRYADSPKTLILNNGVGDEVSFDFDENTKKYEKKWQESHPNKVLWVEEGGFREDEVVALYLNDLKTEIQRILSADKKERDEAEQLQKEHAEKEKAEQEKKEVVAEGKETALASSGATSGSDDKKEEKIENEKESTNSPRQNSQTVYYPKTNQQLYDELKALTDSNPGMLNDPDVRSQLRNYKAFADRDGRNMRDHQTYQAAGGINNPGLDNYMSSAYQTNARIANAEMGVGAAVDGLTSIVNSIIAENNRKEQQRIADAKQREAIFLAKREALYSFDRETAKERERYVEGVLKELSEIYDSEYNVYRKGYRLRDEIHNQIRNEPLIYETEMPETWNGGYQVFNHQTGYYEVNNFIKKKIVLGSYSCWECGSTDDDDWSGNEQYSYLYIVSKEGKYGLVDDAGSPIYAPQFENIVALNSANSQPRFLVRIKDKWGEIFSDGTIENEIKYDGIWYLPNRKKLLLLNGQWFVQPFDSKYIEPVEPKELVPVYWFADNKIGTNAYDSNRPVLLSTKDARVQNETITTSLPVAENTTLFKLDSNWFLQTFDGTTQKSSLEKMPDVFVQKIQGEATGDGTGNKYGAVNQFGEMVLPFKYSRLDVNLKAQTITTEEGLYDLNGKLINAIDLSAYTNVDEDERLGITWYIKPKGDTDYMVECGILDKNYLPVYSIELSKYNRDEGALEESYRASLFDNYAGWLLANGGDSKMAVDILNDLAQGNAFYYKKLGHYYFEGAIGNTDFDSALQYYMKYLGAVGGVEKADSYVLLNVGKMYQEGKGLSMDKRMGVVYYQAGKRRIDTDLGKSDYSDLYWNVSAALDIRLVECQIELNDIAAAKSGLKVVYKKSAPYFYLNGYIYESTGNLKSARSNYKKALSMGFLEGTKYENLYKEFYGKAEERLFNDGQTKEKRQDQTRSQIARGIMPEQYDEMGEFSKEGLAYVGRNGKFGFIDREGKEVLPLKYDAVGSFSEHLDGLAAVKINDKIGFVDSIGKEVTPLKYESVRSMDGLALVTLNDKMDLIDNTGKEITSFKYDGIGEFSDGLAVVALSGKYGLMDKAGNLAIPLKYEGIGLEGLSEGLVPVMLNGKWGYLDKTGNVVISLKYEFSRAFSEGMAAVKLDEKWGFIDRTGKEIVEMQFDMAFSFKEGNAVVNVGGKWEFAEGSAQYEYVEGGKFGFINKSGNETIPIKYDFAWSFEDGLALAVHNGKWGYLDRSGNEVIPLKYDRVESFENGLAMIMLDNKYGFVDPAGKEVIPLIYDGAEPFFNNGGKARVKLNDRVIFIDKNGNEVKE